MSVLGVFSSAARIIRTNPLTSLAVAAIGLLVVYKVASIARDIFSNMPDQPAAPAPIQRLSPIPPFANEEPVPGADDPPLEREQPQEEEEKELEDQPLIQAAPFPSPRSPNLVPLDGNEEEQREGQPPIEAVPILLLKPPLLNLSQQGASSSFCCGPVCYGPESSGPAQETTSASSSSASSSSSAAIHGILDLPKHDYRRELAKFLNLYDWIKRSNSPSRKASKDIACGRILSVYIEALSTLDLSELNIKSLPASIKKLQNLTKIILRDNQFEEMPEVLCHLSHLEEIDMRNNKLQNSTFSSLIPSKIGNLENLRTIKIEDNPQLRSLPRVLTHLSPDCIIYAKNSLTSIQATPFIEAAARANGPRLLIDY